MASDTVRWADNGVGGRICAYVPTLTAAGAIFIHWKRGRIPGARAIILCLTGLLFSLCVVLSCWCHCSYTVRRTLPNSAPTSACRQPDSSHKRKFAFKYVPFIQRKLVLSLERKISLSGKLKIAPWWVQTLNHTIYALPLCQLYHCRLMKNNNLNMMKLKK